MTELETEVDCPYCGERISVLVDPSQALQEYTEDCSVCCRPIEFRVRFGEDGELLEASASRA